MQCFVYQELFLYSVLDFSTVFGTLIFFLILVIKMPFNFKM